MTMRQTIPQAPVYGEAAESETSLRDAVRGFTDDQVTKALALIAANGIVKVPGLTATYAATSSDGVTRYVVDPYGCQCPAGRKHAPCYHRAAVLLLDAARCSVMTAATAERYPGEHLPKPPGRAKLTPARVWQIREQFWCDSVPQRRLAAEFGVAASTVSDILTAKTWRWLA